MSLLEHDMLKLTLTYITGWARLQRMSFPVECTCVFVCVLAFPFFIVVTNISSFFGHQIES